MDIALTLTRMSANMVGQIAGRNNDHKREVVSRKKMIKLLKTKHLIPNENYTWMVMKTRDGLRYELTLHILIQIFMNNFNIMINHYLIW